MTDNNGFKEFVRTEITNVKDAAERNYDEHQTIFATLTDIRVTLAGLKAEFEARSKGRAALIGLYGTVGAAFVMALVALIIHYT